MDVRPPLDAAYSHNHTTVYVRSAAATDKEADAFVFCQLKNRACRRDSLSHGVHTAWFNARNTILRFVCLREPTGHMPLRLEAQGQEVPPPFHP